MIPFFDRNVGTSVPGALRLVRKDVRVHDEVFGEQKVPDTAIIPRTAQEGWVLITRDKKMHRRPAELDAIRSSRARCVVLVQRKNLTRWDMLRRLVCSWDEIEGLVEGSAGPLILKLYARGRPKKVIP